MSTTLKQRISFPFLLTLLFLFCVALLHTPAHADSEATWRGQSITEFSPNENEKLAWQIVNDGVMGGRSKGNVEYTPDNTMRFWGNLSLENNGGFSTARSQSVNLDLSDDLGLLLKVKGDGRTYEARLDSTAAYRGNPISFSGKFQTKAEKWTQVKVPFSNFKGSWRGRQFPDAKLDASKIKRIWILLADKKSGPFDLEIEWIRTYGKGQGETNVQQRPDEGSLSVTNSTPHQPQRIIATAVADGRFTVFKRALDAAKLTVFFQWDNPLTVFAPTNDAFAKLPDELLAELLKPESRQKLIALLSYHVAPGSFDKEKAIQSKRLKMVKGGFVNITQDGNSTQVNDAMILDADITCSDGIIHAIDTLLLPEAF